jgi:hypothetical protein
VDKKSATLGLGGTREEQIGIEGNHSTICKFESIDDEAYEQVIENIAHMADSALKAVETRERLDKLSEPIASLTLSNMPTRSPCM